MLVLLLGEGGRLDPGHSTPFPWEHRRLNAPFTLQRHLCHAANAGLLPRLLASEAGVPGAARLLRLLCGALFRGDWYAARRRISGAPGAYATVYRCSLPDWAGGGTAGGTAGRRVVVKVVDLPKHIQDRCTQARRSHGGVECRSP